MGYKIKLLSYNIRTSNFDESKYSDKLNNWKYRKQAVSDIVKKYNPDIICFQEDSKDQVKFLINEFKREYNFVLFEEALSSDNQEYNTIFLKKKYKILKKQYKYISNTPIIKSKMKGSLFTRHLTYIECEIGERKIRIINVHLDNSENSIFKKNEAKQLTKIINNYYGVENNLIMLGDFNFTTDDNDAYKIISKKFIDVSKIFNVREPTHPNWLMWNIYKQIDYCWVISTKEITPRSFEIIKDKYIRKDGRKIEPSDHFPIKCVIDLK